MALDFQQVQQQVKQFGEQAALRAGDLHKLKEEARALLHAHAQDWDRLRHKVNILVRQHDPNLRCARPVDAQLAPPEPLDAHYPLPAPPSNATLLAADGSQIMPDRHAEVYYGLVNLGVMQMTYGSAEAPETTLESQLFYDEQFPGRHGETLNDATLALRRDLEERRILYRLAVQAIPPVITLTDGPMELWGAKEAEGSVSFEESLDEYQEILLRLRELNAISAGYVDKPAANLVVRLLEVARLPESDFPNIREYHPYHGLTDLGLFRELLAPGERSAIFAIQSRSGMHYTGALTLHFFYLNVGRLEHPWLARVETPAWVIAQPALLDILHTTLVSQCRLLGARPYPYLLHRAHEAALVSLPEKEQVTQMIVQELRRHGVEVGEISNKQFTKNLPGRARYY